MVYKNAKAFKINTKRKEHKENKKENINLTKPRPWQRPTPAHHPLPPSPLTPLPHPLPLGKGPPQPPTPPPLPPSPPSPTLSPWQPHHGRRLCRPPPPPLYDVEDKAAP